MTMAIDWTLARALLEWQVELGVTDAVLAEPVDRFVQPAAALDEAPMPPAMTAPGAVSFAAPDAGAPLAPAVHVAAPEIDAVALATQAAQRARSLPDLAEALADFAPCELRRGARNCVFSDGNPNAQVMIVGEGPGAEEDKLGKPFVGRAGQLLDQMFGAIGLTRSSPDPAASVYITNTVPWRPPGNREPTPEELAMLRPFLLRHIELAAPRVLVLVGNVACDALLGRRGILRLRGHWTQAGDLPAMPMTHPAYLLRNPAAKREAWADLLSIKARLASGL